MENHAAWVFVKDAKHFRNEVENAVTKSNIALDNNWVAVDFCWWNDMFLTDHSSPVMLATEVAKLDMGFLPTFVVGPDGKAYHLPGEAGEENVRLMLKENPDSQVALLLVVTEELAA